MFQDLTEAQEQLQDSKSKNRDLEFKLEVWFIVGIVWCAGDACIDSDLCLSNGNNEACKVAIVRNGRLIALN